MSSGGHHPRAFTLVELVLAVGITALLAALLLGLVTNTLGIWQRGAATLQVESAGGVVIDRVAEDLAGWVYAADRERWRWTAGDDDGGRSELRFLSTVASTAPDGGDVSGVRLVVYAWDAPGRRLYRWESTVIACLENGYSLDSADVETGPEWILADGVVDFAVRWLDDAPTEIAGAASSPRPRHAEVRLTLIDEEGRRRIAAAVAGASTEPLARIEAETTRTLTRWVGLAEGGPL